MAVLRYTFCSRFLTLRGICYNGLTKAVVSSFVGKISQAQRCNVCIKTNLSLGIRCDSPFRLVSMQL